MTEPESAAAAPLLSIVKGDPTPEELAAVVAVLALRRRTESDDAEVASAAVSAWSAPSRRMRPALRPAPDAWRLSALPR